MRKSGSIEAGHHLVSGERLEVVDIQAFGSEAGFEVGGYESVVEVGVD